MLDLNLYEQSKFGHANGITDDPTAATKGILTAGYLRGTMRYIDKFVLLDDIVERSPQQSSPPGVADLKVFQENKVRANTAKESLSKAGFTTTDIEVYLNLHENSIIIMDLGQVMPVSKEAVSACIQSIVQMYNLPEIFVKMLANKYWLYHENRR